MGGTLSTGKTTYLNKSNSPLRCSVFDNVTILPQISVGIIGDKPLALYACGAFCDGKALPHVHSLPGFGRVNAQLPYVKAEHIIEEEVIFGGEFLGYQGQWGHFLLETLQRLWYAQHKELPIAWLAQELRSGDSSLFYSRRHEEVFHNLGITNEHIIITEPTVFSKVHFPEPGLGISGYAHPEHIHFLGYHEGTVRKGRHVYFSRSRFGQCTNEVEIEEILKKHGWEIVYPEDLQVSEQLDILTTAHVCMMISGSAQHSLLLTKDSKTRFIVIPRIHNKIYDVIANFKSDEYFIFNIHREIHTPEVSENEHTFTVDIAFLQLMLEKTANFVGDLSEFPTVFTKPQKLTEQDTTLPSSYYTIDHTITKEEEYFYNAIISFKCRQYEEAYRVLMLLYKTKRLEFHMYDQFFAIIEQYDTIHGTKTELPYDKNQFYLERGKRICLQRKISSHNSTQ